MKYTPKILTENVNAPPSSPLRDFFVLGGGLLLIVVGGYVLLGWTVDLIVPYVPVSVETKLAGAFSKRFAHQGETPEEADLQSLLDTLAMAIPIHPNPYRVTITKAKTANALALPGGRIVIFSKLLEEAESRREIAFVLAHELGHFAHRDHFRGIGRALIMIALSSVFMGNDNFIANFFASQVQNAEMKFSQRRELAADRYALELVRKVYGSTEGSLAFMKKLKNKEKRGKLVYYFASHPHPEIRLKALRRMAGNEK